MIRICLNCGRREEIEPPYDRSKLFDPEDLFQMNPPIICRACKKKMEDAA